MDHFEPVLHPAWSGEVAQGRAVLMLALNPGRTVSDKPLTRVLPTSLQAAELYGFLPLSFAGLERS